MITFDEFVAKYNGKFLEVAGSPNALNQCTDLANGYIREVLGFPIIEWTNAVDFPSKAGDNYSWIDNSPTGFPKKGDIVIFKQYGSLYGSAGHIAVVISADVNKMTVFEQNYPTGSKCRIGTHNYLGCRGWLIPKSSIISPPNTMDYKAIFDKTGNIKGLEDRSPKPDFYAPEDEFKKAYVDPTNGNSYVVVKLKVLNDTLSYLRDQSKPIITTTPPDAPQSGDNFEAVNDAPVEVKPDLPTYPATEFDIFDWLWGKITDISRTIWNKIKR